MFKGQRVYSKSVQANGEIMEIDNFRDAPIDYPYKVRFFWGHYIHAQHQKDIKGYGWKGYLNPDNRKWQWCSENDLVPTWHCYDNGENKVALVSKRITDKRLHLVGELPYADEGPADIHIRYGGNINRYPSKLTINKDLIFDKYQQMKMLGDDLTNETWEHIGQVPEVLQNDLIIKPRRSCGGANIKPYDGNLRMNDYIQKKFPKDREFRAHCFLWGDNPVPYIQEKTVNDKSQLCWNKKQGGTFRVVYQDGLNHGAYLGTLDDAARMQMTHMSIDALRRLKYDSGGIDFGMATDGTLKIFEVNSAMGLRERSLFTYKEMFQKLRTLDIYNYKATRWI
jgi:hypothetical protein